MNIWKIKSIILRWLGVYNWTHNCVVLYILNNIYCSLFVLLLLPIISSISLCSIFFSVSVLFFSVSLNFFIRLNSSPHAPNYLSYLRICIFFSSLFISHVCFANSFTIFFLHLNLNIYYVLIKNLKKIKWNKWNRRRKAAIYQAYFVKDGIHEIYWLKWTNHMQICGFFVSSCFNPFFMWRSNNRIDVFSL